LTLTELEGLTQKQAAEMIGISLSGMKSRVQRGRQKLRAPSRTAATSPSTLAVA
jgi:RNA polymerase sigma-70 factor (ECF subfamily)